MGLKHQWLVNHANNKENWKLITHDHAIGDKVLIINADVDCKAREGLLVINKYIEMVQ